MAHIYVVSDANQVLTEVVSALEFITSDITTFPSSQEFLEACHKSAPDLAVLDFQVTNMGAMATCLELHLEESGGRLPHIPVLILIDRRPDVFLARRSKAEGFLVKPLDSIKLTNAAKAVLSGKGYQDESYKPISITH
ncbi:MULTISPECIES: response regulator [Acidithrix]|uniref:Transcriptional regulatory protein CseB n=1 Tax=Acidithrix ferrooxidans TaxID=1280514 RepID=A0A0D8HLY9_9ACTN|nr:MULTISPECIES: response regulator [Acidithrix]KJF18928.1 transcriptional regulatory protein CseB [Acidithrix ferrooxidans]CAG4917202.1 unnamed protein product [Acidithrix sp. C25]